MKKKVLIVDDEDMVRRLLVEVLEVNGYATFLASNGLEGLRQFYENRPDLVISDMTMPLMEGSEFCRIIRVMCDVPIIMVSGAQGTDLKMKMLTPHVDLYIEKPLDVGKFLSGVSELLAATGRGDSDTYPVDERLLVKEAPLNSESLLRETGKTDGQL